MTCVKFTGFDAIAAECKPGRVYDSSLEDIIFSEFIISHG